MTDKIEQQKGAESLAGRVPQTTDCRYACSAFPHCGCAVEALNPLLRRRPATVKAFRDNTGFASPDGAWVAYDTETYDGAPDAGRAAHLLGRGHTEAEALADWDREAAELSEENLLRIVNEQASDPMLWCEPGTIVEHVLQQALRRLHEAVEGKSAEQCAKDALNAAG